MSVTLKTKHMCSARGSRTKSYYLLLASFSKKCPSFIWHLGERIRSIWYVKLKTSGPKHGDPSPILQENPIFIFHVNFIVPKSPTKTAGNDPKRHHLVLINQAPVEQPPSGPKRILEERQERRFRAVRIGFDELFEISHNIGPKTNYISRGPLFHLYIGVKYIYRDYDYVTSWGLLCIVGCVFTGLWASDQWKAIFFHWISNKKVRVNQLRKAKEPKSWMNGWYCWWKKSCTAWDLKIHVNKRIFTISTGAGFQPSTVFFCRNGIAFSEDFPAKLRATSPHLLGVNNVMGLVSWRRYICWMMLGDGLKP